MPATALLREPASYRPPMVIRPIRAARPKGQLDYRACLIRNLPLVKEVVRSVGRRYRVSEDEEADLLGATFVKLIDDDYAVLRRFRGESRLRTFLFAVVHRLLLDRRNSAWGKWRPSSKARRLGAAAIRLEELTIRDNLTASEAREIVASDNRFELSAEQAAALQAALPQRVRRVHSSLDAADALGLSSANHADDEVRREELQREAARVRATLAAAVGCLTAEDREIVRMRFEDGCSIADIARATGANHKALYRRFESILGRLRQQLERRSVTGEDVAPLVGHPRIEIGAILGARSASAQLAAV